MASLGTEKAAVLLAFNALLGTQDLELQAEAAIERALHMYGQAAVEFADCLHAGLCGASGKAPLLTFDVKASRLPDTELITR